MSADSYYDGEPPQPSLEVVQLEMLLNLSDLVAKGFETTLLEVLEDIGGRFIFNRRIEADPRFQRVAAAVVGPDRDVALIFLDHSGTATHVELAATSRHPMAQEAITESRREDSPQE